jgi:hypothetical protein
MGVMAAAEILDLLLREFDPDAILLHRPLTGSVPESYVGLAFLLNSNSTVRAAVGSRPLGAELPPRRWRIAQAPSKP